LFAYADVALVVELARLASSVQTARRRLRLLLALDAMMLWRPDAVPDIHDEWWAVDDGTRAQSPDLDVSDLLIYRKGSHGVRS
jgi:hypothetical protein